MKYTILNEIKQLIKENNGGVDIIVDIQPEYENRINFLDEFIEYLNENASNKRMILLYNGESMGMVNEDDYKLWLYDNGLDENVLNDLEFYDKGYGFFRDIMDHGIDFDDIISVIKIMVDRGYHSSDEIEDDEWEELGDLDEIHDFLDSYPVYVPDVLDYLNDFDNINLMGGAKYECLAEVILVLQILDKQFELINEFIYE